LLALLTLVVALAAGCGGSDASDEQGVAQIDTGGSDSDGAKSGDGGDQKDRKEVAYEWAKCMRKEGVPVADPDANGMLTITPGTSRAQVDADDFDAAREKCGDPAELGMLPEPTEAESKQMQEGLLAFAKCMRERGIEIPDPEFSEGRGSVKLPDGDLNSPKFQAAQKACGKHMNLPTAGGGAG
jgi:hypothetical protein